jgi:hypothetical protein
MASWSPTEYRACVLASTKEKEKANAKRISTHHDVHNGKLLNF